MEENKQNLLEGSDDMQDVQRKAAEENLKKWENEIFNRIVGR